MTIDHVVDGETELDSALFNPWVDHMNGLQTGAIPIALAGIEDALGEYGPLKNIVSADWYSDLNDAVTAAGAGGIVQLTSGASYTHTSGDPILLIPGLAFVCHGKPAVITTSGNGFAVSNPLVRHRDVVLSGISLTTESGAVGIDWRGFTRGVIDRCLAYGFSDTALWLGGNYPAYESSWTNTVRNSEFLADADSVRFSGVTGVGSSTANNISLIDCVVYVSGESGSVGIRITEGDTNLVQHCDISYSPTSDGVALYLGAKSWNNTFIANRTEDVPVAVRTASGAGYCVFVGNTLGSSSLTDKPVELVSGTEYFLFAGNTYRYGAPTPYVDVLSGATNHRIIDNSSDYNPVPFRGAATSSGGALAQGEVFGDAHPRATLTVSGALVYSDPVTAAVQAVWGQISTGQVGPQDETTALRVSKYASLPAASAARRGNLLRIDGGTGVADGLYVCRKKADDSYEWGLIL